MKARFIAAMVIAVLLAPACDGGKEEKDRQTTIRFAAHSIGDRIAVWHHPVTGNEKIEDTP